MDWWPFKSWSGCCSKNPRFGWMGSQYWLYKQTKNLFVTFKANYNKIVLLQQKFRKVSPHTRWRDCSGKFHLTRGEGTAAEKTSQWRPFNRPSVYYEWGTSGGICLPPGKPWDDLYISLHGGDTPPELYTFFQGTRCLTCIQGIVILSTAGKQL